MKLSEIKKIIDIINKNNIEEFELEQEGIKIRIKKRSPQGYSEQVKEKNQLAQQVEEIKNKIEQAPPPPEEQTEQPQKEEDDSISYITSPIVGTFFRAPNPDADSYVEIGDKIESGQVLCIIEAMKLMNEIVSDRAGEIVDILPKNEQAVEYGEKLFAIKTI